MSATCTISSRVVQLLPDAAATAIANRMRLLLANDDGIYSPGLAALASVAAEFGDLHIVAPDVEQSSMGQAITHSRPISIKRTPIGDYDAHRVNGTPADCVALGVDLFKGVDVVLSGINMGPVSYTHL